MCGRHDDLKLSDNIKIPLTRVPKDNLTAVFNPASEGFDTGADSINKELNALKPAAAAAPPTDDPAMPAPLPPAPDWTSEALLKVRRARSLLGSAGAAGDTSQAATSTTYAKGSLGA